MILGVATASKSTPFLKHISTFFNFLQCYFFMFFRVFAFSIFCDFRCPEAPFLYQVWRYFESPGALKKPLKLCNCRQFQRFGPFQKQSFCKSLLRVRFDSEFFRFLWFLAVLRVPFWHEFWRYFESPGPLKKLPKLCNCHQFQRFGPFQIQSFCKCLLRVRFDSAIFRFLWFLAVLRFPFWDLFVLIVVKKEVWKKDVKNDQKGVRK